MSVQTSNVAMLGGSYNSINQNMIIPIGATKVTLQAGGTAISSANVLQFIKMNAPITQTQYRVPSGKSFVTAGFYFNDQVAETGTVNFGYDTVAFSNKTAPSGTAVYYSASSSITDSGLNVTTTAYTPIWFPYPMEFPSLSFPFVRANIAAYGVVLVGYEI